MKSRLVLVFLFLIGLLLTACNGGQPTVTPSVSSTPQAVSATPQAKASYLVLVSVDSCRPDYFSIADVPNINKLISEGTSYSDAWVGQVRNDTPPGHTSMATGSFPKNDGILGFTWKDPVTLQQIRPTDWDPVVSGNMTAIIAQSGCTSIGSLFKEAYPGALVAAISSDKFYAATGLGAESADYILFNAAQHMKEYASKGGPNLAPGGVNGHLAPADIMSDPSLVSKKVNDYDGDTWAVDLALKLFNEVKPQIMLINLPQTDHSGHATGGINDPKEMGAVVGNADKQIGRLMDAYKQAGIYDRTVFVILSDHGMTPTVPGFDMATVKKLLGNVGIGIQVGGEQIYLNDPARAEQAAEIIASPNLTGINGVYFKQKSVDGSYSYLPALTTAKSAGADLNLCYQYLTSTFASEKSSDLLLATPDVNWQKADNITAGGHGSVHWTNQHIPLIISGPGVKSGMVLNSPARIVDVAPTVLALMGIEPRNMDGIVLADALVSPSKAYVLAQEKVNTQLVPLQQALKAQSAADMLKAPRIVRPPASQTTAAQNAANLQVLQRLQQLSLSEQQKQQLQKLEQQYNNVITGAAFQKAFEAILTPDQLKKWRDSAPKVPATK
jgi:predicted AlkP superfamily pyrophosphatase or phosphodiesterase